ncbi:MAG TPA: type III secretion protein, partial [Sinorhizobium sp.]|nr:type III secretion protein [Sinorhizobium sp.]
FVGRSARQFPLNDSAAAFKNLAVAVVLVVYTTFITTYFGEAWVNGFADIRALLEPSLGEE